MRAGRISGPAVVARVVGIQCVEIDAGEFGGKREIELPADIGQGKLRFITNIGKRQAECCRVFDDRNQCDQSWHIGTGLFGQRETEEIGWC